MSNVIQRDHALNYANALCAKHGYQLENNT